MIKNAINYSLDEFITIERSGVVQTWVKHLAASAAGNAISERSYDYIT